jgi:hypothetical protein
MPTPEQNAFVPSFFVMARRWYSDGFSVGAAGRRQRDPRHHRPLRLPLLPRPSGSRLVSEPPQNERDTIS